MESWINIKLYKEIPSSNWKAFTLNLKKYWNYVKVYLGILSSIVTWKAVILNCFKKKKWNNVKVSSGILSSNVVLFLISASENTS